MTTIEFSPIPDAETDYETIVRLMADFTRETGIEVKLKRMEWGDAAKLAQDSNLDPDSTVTQAMDSLAEGFNPTLG
jgi:hypothetical protein